MSQVDGGVVALTGFLYQTIGVAALKAWAACEDQPQGDPEFEAHVAVPRPELKALVTAAKGAVHPEAFDQDALYEPLEGLVKGAGLALAQFKYSRNQEEEQIDPSEIRKILDKLVAARSRIPEAMGSVAQYFLVTNRKLSVGAAKAVKEAHEGQPVTGDFNENQVKDLAKLQVIEGLKFSALYPPLNQFAQRLGLFPDEIEKGLNNIVGVIIRATVEHRGCRLSKEELVGWLTGHRNVRSLTRHSLGMEMRIQVENLHANVAGGLVQREIMVDVESAAAGRALLLFTGEGGSGKTASLHQWAKDLAAHENGPLVGSVMTRTLSRAWLPELVQRWRGIPEASSEPAEKSIRRLQIANPNLPPPVLHLSLDGFDEELGDEQLSWARELLNLFRDIDSNGPKPPPARLVVTCRDEGDFYQRYSIDSSGFGHRVEDRIPTFTFGRFSVSEFRLLARNNLPIAWHVRLFPPSEGIQSGSPFLSDSLATISAGGAEPAVDPDFLETLRDPLIWGSFMRLDEPDREAALSGDIGARRQMARVLIERFCAKAELRTKLNRKLIFDALRMIAAAIAGEAEPWNPRQEWLKAASGMIGPAEAATLFDEAISGGLLRKRERWEWNWRHALIAQNLLA